MSDRTQKTTGKEIGGFGTYAKIGGGRNKPPVDSTPTQTPQPSPQPAAQPTPAGKVKRERMTVYLPPDLDQWVRMEAVKSRREISEVVAEAVVLLRSQSET